MRLPKGEIEGLKRFEKSRADNILCVKLYFSHRYSPRVCVTLPHSLKEFLPICQHEHRPMSESGTIIKLLADLPAATTLSAADRPDRRKGERVKGGLGVPQTIAPEKSRSSLITLMLNSLLVQRGGPRLVPGSGSGQLLSSVPLGLIAHWK